MPTLRFSRQTAAEDNLWLMLAKPELAPNLNKAYKIEWSQMRASEAAYKAFEGGQIDFATVSGNSALAAALFAIFSASAATEGSEASCPSEGRAIGTDGRPAGVSGAGSSRWNCTRRFCARPWSVSLGARGRVMPKPS